MIELISIASWADTHTYILRGQDQFLETRCTLACGWHAWFKYAVTVPLLLYEKYASRGVVDMCFYILLLDSNPVTSFYVDLV